MKNPLPVKRSENPRTSLAGTQDSLALQQGIANKFLRAELAIKYGFSYLMI